MDYREKVREALKVRCVHLKTKASFLGLPTSQHQENPFDTAVWWCERTCRSMGPDDSSAHPTTCEAPGRTCYEGPVRL